MIIHDYNCINGHRIRVVYPDYLNSNPILNKSIEDMLKNIEEYYKTYLKIERLNSRRQLSYFDIEKKPIINEIDNCYKILSDIYERFNGQIKPYHWEFQFGRISGEWIACLEKG